eukprot:TRINITY_DN4763_c1_g1_i1.p2 TRINITY_DN4763_c1_g1~~TRINITY_DN4763_c1_g1_i1.p2  ORF type:complete len:158 (+),score=1.81 TRINITY_DN4763_c1_g1_i1:430-903(+)
MLVQETPSWISGRDEGVQREKERPFYDPTNVDAEWCEEEGSCLLCGGLWIGTTRHPSAAACCPGLAEVTGVPSWMVCRCLLWVGCIPPSIPVHEGVGGSLAQGTQTHLCGEDATASIPPPHPVPTHCKHGTQSTSPEPVAVQLARGTGQVRQRCGAC